MTTTSENNNTPNPEAGNEGLLKPFSVNDSRIIQGQHNGFIGRVRQLLRKKEAPAVAQIAEIPADSFVHVLATLVEQGNTEFIAGEIQWKAQMEPMPALVCVTHEDYTIGYDPTTGKRKKYDYLDPKTIKEVEETARKLAQPSIDAAREQSINPDDWLQSL